MLYKATCLICLIRISMFNTIFLMTPSVVMSMNILQIKHFCQEKHILYFFHLWHMYFRVFIGKKKVFFPLNFPSKMVFYTTLIPFYLSFYHLFPIRHIITVLNYQ